MKKFPLVLLTMIAALLLNGSAPPPPLDPTLLRELEGLRAHGVTHRFLDNDLVEVKQDWSGTSRVFSLRQPSEAQILAWADTHGVPVLTINPNTIDTSRFTGWYRYWTQVPLSNDILIGLVAGDVNRNGKTEVYGNYHDFNSIDFETRAYEIDSLGGINLIYNYGQPRPGPSRLLADVDKDSLLEVTFTLGGVLSHYEQVTRSELPISFRFSHQRYQGNLGVGITGNYIGDLDGDASTDFLYQGTEPDSSDTTRGIAKTYVAEYDSQANNFQRVWGQQLHRGLGGFAVADFDLDRRKDFVASSVFGNVYVVENSGNNQYQLVWKTVCRL